MWSTVWLATTNKTACLRLTRQEWSHRVRRSLVERRSYVRTHPGSSNNIYHHNNIIRPSGQLIVQRIDKNDNIRQPYELHSPVSKLPYSSHLFSCFTTPRRFFHATRRDEIVPLVIGVGVIVLLGRYSYKALQRMDAEWEDYQWELRKYEKQRQMGTSQDRDSMAPALAIDLGSLFTKLATTTTDTNSTAKQQQQLDQTHRDDIDVVVSREGDRAFFNGVAYDPGSTVPMARGRAALERFFYHTNNDSTDTDAADTSVRLPWLIMTTQLDERNQTEIERDAVQVVSHSLTPALGDAYERLGYDATTNTNANKDKKDAETKPDKPVPRKIITIPIAHEILHVLPAIVTSVLPADDTNPLVLLPEPVAAIWGAQARNLLPLDDDPTQPHVFLIIDVGAYTTQLSIVRQDILLHALAIPFGGETLVRVAMNVLLRHAETHYRTRPTDARSLSAIQRHAREAVAALTAQSRVDVRVPYLFPDPAQHHLDASLSRPVLEQGVNDYIAQQLTKQLVSQFSDEQEHVLSPHLPLPTNLSTLFTSLLTQVLLYGHQTPATVSRILVIGGGSKPPWVAAAVRNSWFQLSGSADGPLVIPDRSMAAELTVVGAATLLPEYTYSIDAGLQRV